MLLKAGNRILKTPYGFASITQDTDIVLKITVRGTCFPARRVSNGNAILEVYSTNSIDNKIYIDYSDGTGEQEYAFKSSGATRGILFTNRANQTTPSTVPGTTTLDQNPLHFYQDLPPGVIDTVDNDYPQQRDIFIRFEKPQNITYLRMAGFIVFGVFPSAVSKLRALQTLILDNLVSLTSFAQDFYNSAIRNLTIANSGTVLENGFSEWILQSPMVNLNLAGAINLSGSHSAKKFDRIDELKDTLETLNISASQIDAPMPEELGELYKLTSLDVSANLSTATRMPTTLSGFSALGTNNFYATRMPMTEIERIMDDLPVGSSYNIANSNYISDYSFTGTNGKVKHIYIGVNNRWNNRAVPSFISQLTALETLGINFPGNTTATTDGLREWGDFSAATTIKTITIDQHTQFVTTIPAWFSSLVNLKTFQCRGTFLTQTRMDEFVDNLYAFVVANASMVTGNTAFRQMTIATYGLSSTLNALSFRPTGTYQMPAGYSAGVSNGTPLSQMEKIWVLTNQYAHTWTVKP